MGQSDQTEYAKKAKVWAHGLKLVDPTIKLVSCGEQVSRRRSVPPAYMLMRRAIRTGTERSCRR